MPGSAQNTVGSSSPEPNNGRAIAALVLGIVAITTGFIPVWGLLVGIAAIILGILGLKKPGQKGLAIAGLATGGVGLITGLFATAYLVLIGVGFYNNYLDHSGSSSWESSEKTTTSQSKTDYAKGENARFGNLEVEINSVERNYNPGSDYAPAEDGKEYILLNLTISNRGDSSEYVSPYDFYVNNQDELISNSYLISDSSLDYTTLVAGKLVKGGILYEVPKDASGLKLQYTDYSSVYSDETGDYGVDYTLAF